MSNGKRLSSDQVPVGAYARVSDPNGTSVPVQLKRLDDWVEREPTWKLAFRRSDDGISASRYAKGKKRPDWEKTMDDVRENRIEILLLWELSRATRDRMVYAALFAACLDNGVRIGLNGRVYNLEDPDDAFDLDLKAILAVRESSVTSKRVTDIVRGLAAQGRPHGRIPYGYSRTYNPVTKKCISQEIDPVTSKIVKEIVKRVKAGEWLEGIARDLNERKVPTPWAVSRQRAGADEDDKSKDFKWSDRAVRRIATDPTLAGYRKYNGELIKADWPAIVSKKDHKLLTDRFADTTRTTNGGKRTVVHLGTNLFVCGKCGAHMRRSKNRGNADYNCSALWHVSRNQARTDELVSEMAIARLERPDALELLAIDDEDQKTALASLRELEARMESFDQQAAAGKLSAERLGKMERLLGPQIEEARRKAEPRDVPAEVLELAKSGEVRKRWERLTVAQRRIVIRCLMTVRIMSMPRNLPANTGPKGGKTPKGRWYPEYVRIEWHYPAPEEQPLSA